MQDTATELNYYPKAWLSPQGFDRALCIAPHPDDEVLSCGGALMLLAQNGAHVQSLILTGGEKALGSTNPEHAKTRQLESIAAAQIMGTQPPVFLGFPDRGLHYSEALIQAILEGLQNLPPSATRQPALLFLPSLSEPHPDHQATALAGLAAAQRWGQSVCVLFCEIGAPLQPNFFMDISAVAEQKALAVAQFKSQNGLENYVALSRAMGTLRAFGKSPECTAAEAFFKVDLDALQRQGPLAALPQWPWIRQRLQLANSPEDLPLVSILIRSMDRASLAETLASVAQQTYPHIEIVLVNASGLPHGPVEYLPQHLNFRLIQPEGFARLGRSDAANEALKHAQGNLALFLDDDDLIAPDHIQRLVQTLHQHTSAVAAYSGVRVVDGNGHTLREYDIPWHQERLQGINFLPIHAVLFRLSVVRERRLCFDPDLPVLEDWDFWRQLGQEGHAFAHSPGITATYRQTLGQSGLSEPGNVHHWQDWHLQLLQRYLSQKSIQDIAKSLAWHAIELDKADHRISQAEQAQAATRQQLQNTQFDLQRQIQQSQQDQAAYEQLQQKFNDVTLQMQVQLAAKEAQLQAFAAESSQVLAAKEAQLQNFAIESNQALADKELRLQVLALENRQVMAAKDRELSELRDRLDRLMVWTHKITRWLPPFLHYPKDKP